MKNKSSLKYKIGLILIIFSFAMPVFAFAVPFLGFSSYITAFIAGVFIVGGPELAFFIGIILVGKEAANLIKNKLFKPAGKIRYKIGLIIFCISILLNWISSYLEVTDLLILDIHNRLYLMASLDIILIISVFIMGPEFFIKFKKLFSWENVEEKVLNDQ